MKRLALALLISAPAFAVVSDTSDGKATLTANGATTAFVFLFPVQNKTDVQASVALAGVAQLSVYTVVTNSDQTASPGGTVTFTAAPVNGATVTIKRVQALTQGTSFAPFSQFPAKTTERAFDGTIMRVQQVDRRVADLETKEAADVSAVVAGAVGAVNLLQITATGQSTGLTLPTWFSRAQDVRGCGAKGDGTTDDYASIQTCINAASSVPNGIVIFPPSVAGAFYKVGSPINVPGNVTLMGYGAVLKFFDANLFTSVFQVRGGNVTIEGFEINGNKTAFGATEFKHGIDVEGTLGVPVTRVTLRDIYSHDNQGDGLYIGSCSGCGLVSNVFVSNYLADANHRNGVSITTLKNGKFVGLKATNTVGTAPQDGIDIEPNFDTDVIEDLDFEGCTADGNAASGAQVLLRVTPSAVERNIRFRGCTFNGNAGVGLKLSYLNSVSVSSSEISSNGSFGIDLEQASKGLSLIDNLISLNVSRGAFIGPSVGLTVSDTKIIGNRFLDNSTGTPNSTDGLSIGQGAGPVTDVVITGNTFSNVSGATQRFGLTTGSLASQVRLIGNSFAANATAAASLTDDPATRFAFGNQGMIGQPCSSSAFDFPSVANGASSSTDLTVTGTVAGDEAKAVLATSVPAGVSIYAQGVAANTIRVSLINNSGVAYDAPNVTLWACLYKR